MNCFFKMNMKRYITIAFVALAFILSGCKEIQNEIDELYNEIEELKNTDAAIKQQLEGFNNSLTSLQTIIAALQSGVYIKSVMPLVEDNSQVGYIFTLSNGETFNVRDGKKGADGYMPVIGVLSDEEGNYWWTLDGDYLLDGSGSRVKADGVVPQFNIVDGFWNVSYDNGKTWIELGKANGSDGAQGKPGDSLFSSVDYTEGSNVAKFILTDGTELVLPCYQAISITFNVEDNTTCIAAGETIKVDYSLSYGDDKTVVTVSSDGNYIAKVIKKNNVSGTILITCPGLYMDGYVNVMAFDGVGYSSVSVINFYEKEMIFSGDLTYNVDTDAGHITIPVKYNFDYHVEVEGDAQNWIILDEKTKATYEEGEISFSYSQNNGSERTGVVNIYPNNAVDMPYAKITVKQRAAYFNFIEGGTSLVASSEGGAMDRIRIESSRVLTAAADSSWAHCSVSEPEPHIYCLDVTVDRNKDGQYRSCKIPIVASDDGSVLETIEVFQMDEGGNSRMDLVFEVRVSEKNDYTSYLPIGRRGESKFIVEWGDGKFTDVGGDYSEVFVMHKYETGNAPTTYHVRVHGTVTQICSEGIEEGYRSSIVAVEQWGNIGLKDMYHAFQGFTSLERLADDKERCFSAVRDFTGAFERCPRLTSIPSGLFQYASQAEEFNCLFMRCESLSEVPSLLFSHCTSALDFQHAFRECYSLEKVGDGILNGCFKACDFTCMFYDCRLLKAIPSDLFKDVLSAKTFNNAFGRCKELKAIPEGLFASCVSASNFSSAFEETAINAIPARLFANCPAASDFTSTFANCKKLLSIPATLFDNNRKITYFERTFQECSGVRGESPYTMVNGKKVHLYERVDYPDHFVTPISHQYCFQECGNLSDYQNIPSSWIKEN